MKFAFLFSLLIFSSVSVFAGEKFDKRLKNLVLRAKLLDAKLSLNEPQRLFCSLKLRLTLTNEGSEPIIILKPADAGNIDESTIIRGGISLYAINFAGTYPIMQSFPLTSASRDPFSRILGKVLDKSAPPEGFTRILKPKDSVSWMAETNFNIPLKTRSRLYGFDEIKKSRAFIRAEVAYSMFPNNLNYYKKDFGKTLKKRWNKHGILFFHGNHSIIRSERFDINSKEVEIAVE